MNCIWCFSSPMNFQPKFWKSGISHFSPHYPQDWCPPKTRSLLRKIWRWRRTSRKTLKSTLCFSTKVVSWKISSILCVFFVNKTKHLLVTQEKKNLTNDFRTLFWRTCCWLHEFVDWKRGNETPQARCCYTNKVQLQRRKRSLQAAMLPKWKIILQAAAKLEPSS